MTAESVISEEMKQMIGVEAEPIVLEVEKGHIRRFAQAVGDPNPLWQDEAFARRSRYGNIIAPPTFLQDWAMHSIASQLLSMKCPLASVLNAGSEVEQFKPMAAGDILTTRGKLVNIYEKEGKSGRLVFFSFETTFINQHGELVAKGRLTLIRR